MVHFPSRDQINLYFWRIVVYILQTPAGRYTLRTAYRAQMFLHHMFAEAPLWQTFLPFSLASAAGVYGLTCFVLTFLR